MSEDLVYCYHCKEFLSRWTVARHLKTQTKPCARRNRRLPSGGSVDGAQDTLTHDMEPNRCQANDINASGLETLGEEEQEQYWDDESEDDVDQDLGRDTPTGGHFPLHQTDGQENVITQWILCSLMYIQTKCNISDKCIELFLLLLKQIFLVLGIASNLCSAISKVFPQSMYMLRKCLKFDRDDFEKLVVCSHCMALYRFNDVVSVCNDSTHVKKCSNILFGCKLPKQHPNKGKQGKFKCNADLVQKIKVKNNKIKYYPLKVFCFRSLINSLETFLRRPNFKTNCNKWRNRKQTDLYADVYDGKIWEDFQLFNAADFLKGPNNYAAMINVDWFQPFKRRSDYSIGVIYLVFLNLPRSERFKLENVCLLGVVPALKKEPTNLNSFLKPIVEELQILLKGIVINKDKVKLLLLCAASDIPAARKLSGHMGHAAIKGCSFCEISFKDCNGKKYYGPVDAKWHTRNREKHIQSATKSEKAKNFTKQKLIQKESGYKYTKLLDLEYFIPSKFSVVEPMHNLFLGTTKKCFQHWIEIQLLQTKELELITNKIKNLKISSNIERLPCNIASNHGNFTAKEWKNWVLVYSLYCLNDVLPERHLKIWHTFVRACQIICQPAIKKDRVNIAHLLFLKFSKEAEAIYGPDFLTPNMHLHGHLKENIENYGSIYGFWAFSFERYNGIMADFPTNKRSIEIQLMRKFLQVGFSADLKYQKFNDKIDTLYEKLIDLKEEPCQSSLDILLAPKADFQHIDPCVWKNLSDLRIKHEGYKLLYLSWTERQYLLSVYKVMYGDFFTLEDITSLGKQYTSIFWKNQYISSSLIASKENENVILAKWANDNSSLNPDFIERPGRVKYFLLHSILVEQDITTHIFAVVDWHKSCENDLGYLPPVSVWSSKHINDGPASYIPVQRIISKCAFVKEKLGNQQFLTVIPTPDHMFV